MPLIGTHDAAAAAMATARNGVKATWLTKNKVLSPAEIAQMLQEVEAAALAALFAHNAASLTVTITAPPATYVTGTGPVTGVGVGVIT